MLNPSGKSGIFRLADIAGGKQEKDGAEDEPVQRAVAYIKANLNKNISRTDVAELVHLNEEYFSRLFKQQTGETFKDYVLLEKMNMAKTLLNTPGCPSVLWHPRWATITFPIFPECLKKSLI